MVSILNKKNSEIEIKHISDTNFEKYGKVLNSEHFQEAFEYLKTLEVPIEGNKYIAHDPLFEKHLSNTKAYDDVFGYSDVQFGYVNGNNEYLNALEYHKSCEVNICLSPLVLFLGDSKDISNNNYDSSLLEAFYVPANTVIEMNAGVLHFSPCKVSEEGFRCGVILPMGTNQDFVNPNYVVPQENELLFKTNKWLISHFENESLIAKGAYPGLLGVNYKIKF